MAADTTVVAGKQPTAKRLAATRRHAPYARPINTQSHSHSIADYVIGFCARLSTPLFSRSPVSRPSTDAFSVPWRTVDRETAQLREELYRAQREAAVFDEKQLQAEQSAHELSSSETRDRSSTDVDKPEDGSPYESVFDTARRIAERRSSALATPSLSSSKGKEAAHDDLGDADEPEDVDFEPNETEDDDEEELLQKDIEPIDESEEVTTSKSAGYSSASNIISTASSPIGSSTERPLDHLTQQTSSDTEGQSVDVSVEEEEESGSEQPIGPDQIEEPQSSSVSASSSDVESDSAPEAEVEIEVSLSEGGGSSPENGDQADVYSEHDSDASSTSGESDQATEELASISSDQSGTDEEEEEGEVDSNEQPAPVSQYGSEPLDAVISRPVVSSVEPVPSIVQQTPQSTTVAPTPSSRGWWPFTNRSLLGSFMSTQKKQSPRATCQAKPEESEEEEEERCVYAGAKRSAPESSDIIPPAHDAAGAMQHPQSSGRQRVLPKSTRPQYSRPFVPASFIDVSRITAADSAKHVSVPDRTGSKRSTLLSSRRHTAALPVMSTPLTSAAPSAETARLSSVSSVSSPPSAGPSATPLITAASLGLEARRSIARGRSGQSRRRTFLYYGSGYGSRSDPYSFTPANYGTSAAGVQASQSSTRSVVQTSYSNAVALTASTDASENYKSNTTAQKILDIIGEVPPTRSQQGLDSQDVINPYELSSPYSVRMRPKTTQRRRVLVPTSARISQADTKTQDLNPTRARSILESIQSAAPPEIQARLGAMSKVATSEKSQYSSAINSAASSAVKLTAAPVFSVPQTTESTLAASVSISSVLQSPPPPIKAQFGTPTTAIETPTKMREASALTTRTVKPIEKENQPPYAFSIPSPLHSGADDAAVKAAVAKLKDVDLPSFAFSLDDDQQLTPSRTSAQSAELISKEQQQPEWTCDVCELKSPAAASRCIVCDAVKPTTTTAAASLLQTAPASGKSLLQAPIVQDSEWVCEVCELKSPISAQKCIVCDAAKPTASATTTEVFAVAAPSAGGTLSALASASAPTSNEWVCEVCELKSPATADKCIVCDAAKPTASATTTEVFAAAAPSTGGTLSALASASAPTSNEWVCEVCELKSPATADKCIVCDAAKPNTSAATLSSTTASSAVPAGQQSSDVTAPQDPSFAFSLDVAKLPHAPMEEPQEHAKATTEPPAEQWECNVCELKNPPAAEKCTVCDAAKPAAAASVGPVMTALPVNSTLQRVSNLSATQLPSFEFDLDVKAKPFGVMFR
ncbi:hypothetical protein COEREDRAFT_8758 [Coemansia reversa NRRL 1564]|uniref:RanBP2-type domain-containing protein n=1 Tax=Coemansia reversa (strain ATCC 12441 / NRRL 1564) TaxID=763665 RepID=A0A2G5BAS1_COERN|nr:hypothetical protein COEREDRAFT_8758 [Coemansia reversa NRRL 1564]|eukprot:PIA16100.1 hypothetical protein COEREDRAFT_8758 [Coemansia reversa NRRL 1564]